MGFDGRGSGVSRRKVPENWEQIIEHVFKRGELHTVKALVGEWLRRAQETGRGEGFEAASAGLGAAFDDGWEAHAAHLRELVEGEAAAES